MNNTDKGREGEMRASSYLNSLGYTILMQNYRVGRYCEIDIIAEKDEYICFIEVKLRHGNSYGFARDSIDARKRKKIRMAAGVYMCDNKITDKQVRFDVIEIQYSGINSEVNLIENAF